MPLTTLNPLTPLAGGTNNSSTPAAQPTTAIASSTAANGPSWLTGTLAQYVTIGIGAILIIAGLFQFKSVREVSGYAAKTGAAAAAV